MNLICLNFRETIKSACIANDFGENQATDAVFCHQNAFTAKASNTSHHNVAISFSILLQVLVGFQILLDTRGLHVYASVNTLNT